MKHFLRSLLLPWERSVPRTSGDVDFKALADNSLDLIVRLDQNQIMTYASPASVAMLGVTPDQLIGRSQSDFVHPEDRPILDEVAARHRAGEEDGRVTFRMIRADETILWVQGSGRIIVDPATGTTDFVVIMRDVTDSKLAEQKLAALALTDGLTGLVNRRGFDEALDREWRRAKRSGTSLSLLLLDVDCFKAFNDHYGHQVGDDCLRAVASAVADRARRPGDLAARYGGEEIAIILPETGSEDALSIGENVRAAVESLAIPHANTLVLPRWVTVSVGIATVMSRVGGSMQMPAALLQAADIALYKAKHLGRNRVAPSLILTSAET